MSQGSSNPTSPSRPVPASEQQETITPVSHVFGLSEVSATTEEFLRDVDTATQTSTTLPSKNAAVEVALHKYREVAKLKLALPLTQLDAAQEEMEKFIQFRLEELQSQQETKNLIWELSSRITDHRGRVH